MFAKLVSSGIRSKRIIEDSLDRSAGERNISDFKNIDSQSSDSNEDIILFPKKRFGLQSFDIADSTYSDLVKSPSESDPVFKIYARSQLCSPWNSTASNSTLVISSPLYLKLAIKVERKFRNSSISNITASNSKSRKQNKTFQDLAGLFSSIPSIFSARRKDYKKKTSHQPSKNNSTPITNSTTTTNEKSNSHIHDDIEETVDISAGKKERIVFNIKLPPEVSELVNTRRHDKPIVKNLTTGSTNPNIMFGKSQSLSAILSVMAAAVALTILLHLIFFPILFKKASVVYRTIQKFLGIKVQEKESHSPSKQRIMTSVSAKGTPVKSSKIVANTNNATPITVTPVSSDIEVTVIEEDPSSCCIKPMDSEIVSPTILITKREPLTTPMKETSVPVNNSTMKADFLSTSHCSTDHLDMCAIYKESNAEGLVDPIDNPIHLEGKRPGDSKNSGFVPNYDTVPEARMGGSSDSDGLLCVYEQESYFVDDNPLCVAGPPELTRKLSKKLLFPSFIYNNPRIRREEEEDKSVTTTADSEHDLDMSSVYEDSSFCKDDVNPLVIATSQLHANKESVPLSSGATTQSTDSNSTRFGRPKLFSPIFADPAALGSPLKMKSKYPSFLLPSGRKSITRDEFDSCVPFDDDDDDSDDDYDDSSIHSFSFSTQTFSPHLPSTRGSTETKGSSSLMMSFGVSPQIIIGGEAAPVSTPRANSLETVSTAPGSWIDCIQQEVVEPPQSPATALAAQLKRGGSLFVRPKAAADVGDITPEQLRALSQLYRGNSGSNHDNTVHNIEGSSDFSSKGLQRQPSQASSMNNSSQYYSTNRSLDARSSAVSTKSYTNNILLSRISPPEVTNVPTRKYSNSSNVSALSGSSGSSGIVSNISKPIIVASHVSSSGVISHKSSSVNSIPSSTAGADAMRAKLSGQKVAESSNMKSPEKPTPTSDFFRRCVSPYKAVSQFVRRTLSPSPTKRQQHNASHANNNISSPSSPIQAPRVAKHTNTNANTNSPVAAPKGIAATATTHNHVSSSRPTTATSKGGVATTQRSANSIANATMATKSSQNNSTTPPKVGMASTYSGMYERKKSFPGPSFPLSSAVVNSNLLKPGSSLVRKSSFNSSYSNSTPLSRVPPLPSSPPNTGTTTITATNSSSHNSPQRPLSGVKGNRVQ